MSDRVKALAAKNGRGMVVEYRDAMQVRLIYCNQSQCCSLVVPASRWDEKKVRALWDQVQDGGRHAP